jgi:hypothetical protein
MQMLELGVWVVPYCPFFKGGSLSKALQVCIELCICMLLPTNVLAAPCELQLCDNLTSP